MLKHYTSFVKKNNSIIYIMILTVAKVGVKTFAKNNKNYFRKKIKKYIKVQLQYTKISFEICN